MNALLVFLSAMAVVFCLGLQSLLVNRNHKIPAFFMSFLIGVAHLGLYKLVPDAGAVEVAAYLIGGPCGIVLSMFVFGHLRKRLPTKGF